MATRPTWQGYLRLSLVSCPVALYTATSSGSDVRFNMLHESTHNRIKMVPTDPETGPVDRSEIVKGYEIEKGRYVVVTDEEVEIRYVIPTGPNGEKSPFCQLRLDYFDAPTQRIIRQGSHLIADDDQVVA